MPTDAGMDGGDSGMADGGAPRDGSGGEAGLDAGFPGMDAALEEAGTDAPMDGGPPGADAGIADGGPPDTTGLSDAGLDAALVPCVPFTGTECGSGWWCLPDPFDATVGTCTEAGSVSVGAACALDGEPCESGARCIGGRCEVICLPAAGAGEAGACSATEGCPALYGEEGELAFGFCTVPCTPFTDVGCAEGKWCIPDYATGVGICADGTGTGTVGSPCADAGCAPGALCLPELGGDSTCYLACAPGVSSPDLGACPDEDVCNPRLSQDFPEPSDYLGKCETTCDFDAGEGCTDGACVAGELLGLTFDVCRASVPSSGLAAGALCADAGLELGNFCGSERRCADVDGIVCAELCRFAVQAADTTAHPDCEDETQFCRDAAGSADFGICLD